MEMVMEPPTQPTIEALGTEAVVHQELLDDVRSRLLQVSHELSRVQVSILGIDVEHCRASATGLICWKLRTNYYSIDCYHELLTRLKRSLRAFATGREVVILSLSFYGARVAVEIGTSLLLKHLEAIARVFLRTEVETIQDFDVLDRDQIKGFSLVNFYGDYLCYLW